MKRSDIDDEHVVELARAWSDWVRTAPIRQRMQEIQAGTHDAPLGVVAALVREGVPEKLAVSKVEHLCVRGLLDYGTSPYHAWPC